jgi:hypothetical protein
MREGEGKVCTQEARARALLQLGSEREFVWREKGEECNSGCPLFAKRRNDEAQFFIKQLQTPTFIISTANTDIHHQYNNDAGCSLILQQFRSKFNIRFSLQEQSGIAQAVGTVHHTMRY